MMKLLFVLLVIGLVAVTTATAQRVYPSMQVRGNNLEDDLHAKEAYAVSRKSGGSFGTEVWTKAKKSPNVASTFVVTTNADTGAGSLRSAINFSNASPGLDVINFNIFSGGLQTIVLRAPLPQFNDPVIIDGTTQPGFAGTPIVQIDGSLAGTGVNGLSLVGGNSIVKGLAIEGFKRLSTGGNGYAILLDINGGNVVIGNYIGLTPDGTDTLPNGSGIGIFGMSGGNIIGGTTPDSRNVISGNYASGVAIGSGSAGGNIVRGNYIGTTADGSAAFGNGGNGIFINAPNDSIGGLEPGSRNIIAGGLNPFPAIFIGTSGGGTVVQGNYIGTDVSGLIKLGYPSNGINVRSANNIIGDVSPGGRNIVAAGGSAGIYLFSQTATHNRIINNYIGTNLDGTLAFPNTKGIVLDDAPRNVVGGDDAQEGNLIAGNSGAGIDILNATATANKILNNYIGTNSTQQTGLGNLSYGININSSLDTVNFNTIAFNNGIGVYVASGTNNLITRNSIYSNTGMGIDNAPAGLTKNDPLDFDIGANNLQNFPILDSSRVDGAQLIVRGKIISTPNAQIRIDFYTNDDVDATHFGEGQTWNSLINVTTDVNGYWNFTTTLGITPGSPPKYITATATDAQGNTSEFSQALCTFDTDGDGLLDSWEAAGWGIDVNSDGVIDLDLDKLDAGKDFKDIFVEVDAMSGMAPTDDLQPVVEAFATVSSGLITNPNGATGISLHIDISDTNLTPEPWLSNWWQSFRAVKSAYFGNNADRDVGNPNSANILEAKKLVYRYCIFAYQHTNIKWSGRAEPGYMKGANDFMVTLGAWTGGGTPDEKDGTFMHELGHTLGLDHGGADDINYKPNYISIMNYSWQMPLRWADTWRLDYSLLTLDPLDEANLDEFAGLGVPRKSPLPIFAVPFSGPDSSLLYAKFKPDTTVDWDMNGTLEVGAHANLNVFADTSSPGQTLTGQDDWSRLIYNFRNSPTFANENPPSAAALADSQKGEMSEETFQILDNLPPPKPSGLFLMDGEIDTSAVVIGSNAGIRVYAAYRLGQLYVATNSAHSQSADMFIVVSDGQKELRPAPSGKAGEVAGWSVYLTNKFSDSSAGWFKPSEAPQTNYTVDSAGTVLEGVIDLELLYGKSPSDLYIAVGKYDTSGGGTLVAQFPPGNGDGNIDPVELFKLIGSPPPDPYFTQDGNKLVPSDAIRGDLPGGSADISSNGNTVIFSSQYDNGYTGATWVFTRTNGIWQQEGNKLVGYDTSGAAQQGVSIALSDDGNTILAGGSHDSSGIGAAWVFVRTDSGWRQQGTKLVGAGVGTPFLSPLGLPVALSGDGNTAIIGRPVDDGQLGSAWVFTRTGGEWRQQGPKLVGSGAENVPYPATQGSAVALSADGNTALVGGRGDSLSRGAVWVFTRTDSVWSQQGNKLIGSGSLIVPFGGAGQGSAIALSSDGNTAMIGGTLDDDQRGAVWVFTRSGGVWTQQGPKLVPTDAVGVTGFGYSISLSSDGNIAAIDGPFDNGNMGSMWVFKRNGEEWSQQSDKFAGTGAVDSLYPPLQGFSVAISADGNTLIEVGPGDDEKLGAGWAFNHLPPQTNQLGSFSATAVNGSDVQLNWNTITEQDIFGFELERSYENTDNFFLLDNSFVAGNGKTAVPHTYSFVDTTVGSGNWTYRLKQIEIGGITHYSDTAQISVLTGVDDLAVPMTFALHQNFPNPFNPTCTFRYTIPLRVQVVLRVYNVLGQLVTTLVDELQDPGYKSVVFNAKSLSSGVYFYRITAGSFSDVKKMLLIR